MKKTFIFLFFLFTNFTFSQNYVHQVLILNEGYFDYSLNQSVVPPTLGSYDPLTQIYTTIDTLNGKRFASDIIVNDNHVFVAADNTLYKYDKFNMSIYDTVNVDGIRNIAIWNDKIIVTRGDYDNTTFAPILFNSYLQVFNLSDLSFYTEFDTINGPKWSTQNMIVTNNKLYVAINNAFEWGNEKGLVGVIDMNNMSYINEIDLGPDGKNPDNLMFYGSNIYSVNNKDWTGASISNISLSNNTTTTTNISSISTGCGTSALKDDKILYQISMDNDLFAWDTQSNDSSGISLGYSTNFYDLSYDQINNLLYTSETDFFSFGTIHIYNNNNNLINSFSCGISPGNIVFDIRTMPSYIEENIFVNDKSYIYDIFGRKLQSLNNQPSGIYYKNGKKIFINNK